MTISPIPSLPLLLAIIALLGAIFVFAAYDLYQLSKPDFDGASGFRPPWAENLVYAVTALLLLFLVAVAVTLGYHYHYGI